MFNIKFITDVGLNPELLRLTEDLRAGDKDLSDQYNWLVQKAKGIDKQRKDMADVFWRRTVEVLKSEGKLPKDFELYSDLMITFGYDGSNEIFTMSRPKLIRGDHDEHD